MIECVCANSRLHNKSQICPRKTNKETLYALKEKDIISELSLNIEFKENQILIDGRDAS